MYNLEHLKNIGLNDEDIESLITIVNKVMWGNKRICEMTAEEAMMVGTEPITFIEEGIQAFAAIVVENSYMTQKTMIEEDIR